MIIPQSRLSRFYYNQIYYINTLCNVTRRGDGYTKQRMDNFLPTVVLSVSLQREGGIMIIVTEAFYSALKGTIFLLIHVN
jgi:hypothetical protein